MSPAHRAAALARLAGRTALAVLSLGTCVIALVLVPPQVRAICAVALGAVEGQPRRSSGHAAGWLALAHAFATALLIVVGSSIGQRTGVPLAGPLVAMLGAIAVGAAWAPMALAPFAVIDGEGGVIPSLVRSFELSARRGARATLALGVEVGALAGLVAPLWASIESFREGAALLAAPVWAVLVTPVIALRLARRYHEAKQLPAFDAARDPRVLSGLRGLLGVIAPAVLALAVALGIAALTPLPMQPIGVADVDAIDVLPAVRRSVSETPRAEVPGRHGLAVERTARGVSIETADGGGAGEVALPRAFAGRYGDLAVGAARHRGQPAWVAVRVDHAVYFDDEGVRLDDGIADRLGARFRGTAAAMMVLALALGMALAALLSRSLRDARALDAPRWARESPVAKGTVARIDGTLALAAGARIALSRGRAAVHGDAHVLAGDVRITLPSEIPLLAMDDVPLNDGDTVTIVAETESLRTLGPRQGSVPFPPGARLVPGDRDHAAERVLGRAARTASLVAIGIAASLGIAALAVVLAS